MSTTVDNRVVQMTFNNKSFEKGVNETLNTLDKLNKSLEFQNASKGFKNIQNGADNTDLSRIASSVESLKERFSGLGIIGMQIWSKIGDSIWNLVTGPFKKLQSAFGSIENQIKTGGWNRALNLDKAANMLKNLGQGYDSVQKEAEKVKITLEDGTTKEVYNRYKAINDAVSGTAYSFDEAALASSNFLAASEDMSNADLTNTLRAAMGIASTYSKDFNQIAGYLQKVQAAGSLTKGIASDMKMVGIAIEPIVKDYLGLKDIKPEDWDDMLSNGLISFEQFRDALVWKFGESLDKANETFEGSINNMKSAMSRTGALFDEPLVASLIPAANEVRVVFNEINKAIGDTALARILPDEIDRVVKKFDSLIFVQTKEGKVLSEFGKKIKTDLTNYFDGFYWAVQSVIRIFRYLGEAISEVFLDGPLDKSTKKSKSFKDAMIKLFQTIVENKDEIVNTFKGFLYILKPILKLALTLIKVGFKLLGIALKIVGLVVGLIGNLITLIVESKIFQTVLNGIKTALEKVSSWIKKTSNFIVEFFKELGIGEKVAKGFHILIDAIKTFFEEYKPLEVILGAIKLAFDKIRDAIKFVIDKFEEFTGINVHLPTFDEIIDKAKSVRDAIVNALEDPKGTADAFLEKMREVRDFLGDKFTDVVETINEKFKTFKGWLEGFTSGFKDAEDSMEKFSKSDSLDETEKKISVLDRISSALDKFGQGLDFIWNTFKTIGKYIVDGLKWAFDQIGELTGIETFGDFLLVIKDLLGILIRYNWAIAAANFGQFFGTLSKVFKQNLGVKSNTALKTIPDALLKISIAMGILALSVIAMSQLKTEDIIQAELALAGIVVLAGLLVKVMAAVKNLFTTYDKDGNVVVKVKQTFSEKLTKQLVNTFGRAANLAALGVLITSFATAILEIMIGITILGKVLKGEDGKIDKEAIIAGLAVVVIVLATLFIALHFMLKEVQNFKKESLDEKTNTLTEIQKSSSWAALLGLSAFLITLTDVVILIAGAIALLSLIPEDNLIKGGIVMAIIMTGLIAIMGAATFFTQNLKKSSNGDGKILKNSSGGNGGALAGLAAFLLALSVAIIAIVPAMILLGALKEKTFWQGVRGILVIGVVIALCIWAVARAEHGLSGAGVILSITVAIVAAALTLSGLGKIKHINKAMLALGLIGIVIGVLMFLSSKLDPSYQAVLIIISIAAAIYVAALAIKELSDISWKKDWWKTLVVIGVFIIALAGLAGLATAIPQLQFALGVVAGSMLAAGAGVFLFAAAISMIIPLIEEVYAKKDELAGKISAFCDIVAETLVGLFFAVIDAFKKRVSEFVTKSGNLLLAIVVGIVNFLFDNRKEIGTTIGHFFAAVAVIIVGAIGTFCKDIGDELKDGFDIGEDGESSSWKNVGSALIRGLAAGLDFAGSALEEAMEVLENWLNTLIDDPEQAWEDAGRGLMSAFIRGLEYMRQAAIDLAVGMFDELYDFLPDVLKEELFGDVYEYEREHRRKMEEEQEKDTNIRSFMNEAKILDSSPIHSLEKIKELSADETSDLIKWENAYLEELEEIQRLGLVQKIEDRGLLYYRDAIDDYDLDDPTSMENKAILDEYNARIGYARDAYKSYQEEIDKLAKKYGVTDFYVYVDTNDIDPATGLKKQLRKTYNTNKAAYYTLGEITVDAYKSGIFRAGAMDNDLQNWMYNIYNNSAKAIGIAHPAAGSESESYLKLGKITAKSYKAGIEMNMVQVESVFAASLRNIENLAANAQITPVFNHTAFATEAASLGAAMMALNSKVQVEVELMNKTNQTKLDNMASELIKLANDTVNANLLAAMQSQNGTIEGLASKIDKIGIYLDGKTLVGGIMNDVDLGLGSKALLVGRGVLK